MNNMQTAKQSRLEHSEILDKRAINYFWMQPQSKIDEVRFGEKMFIWVTVLYEPYGCLFCVNNSIYFTIFSQSKQNLRVLEAVKISFDLILLKLAKWSQKLHAVSYQDGGETDNMWDANRGNV